MSYLVQVLPPTFEHHYSGLGVSTSTPRISWRFKCPGTTPEAWKQRSYEIQATTNKGASESVRRDSPASLLVSWPFAPLLSRQIVHLRVRVAGGKEGEAPQTTEWSPWSTVEAALLERFDWQAQMITPSSTFKSEQDALRPWRVRLPFGVPVESGAKVVKARLYSTAFGVYQAYLNGSVVGDLVMSPGWTSYKHRLTYQIFDVTSLIRQGEMNVLGFEVAEGWYLGRLGWEGGTHYGPDLGVFAQLEIDDERGIRHTLSTGPQWKWNLSPILKSQIYDGETFSAVEEEPDWCIPETMGFVEDAWSLVRVLNDPLKTLISSDAPPVKIIEEINPINILTTPTGKTILDFGQNLVGKLRIRYLTGPPGHKIVFTHAEVLDNAELGTRPLRGARCVDEIITGKEVRQWTPKFTFHGFRYVQVDGWTSDAGVYPALGLSAIQAVVIHSDMTRTGTFECSHPLVNQLHKNIVWSMRGNFLSIPTDCPQRDERLGWTGDIQVFAPTANFLFNTTSFLSSWLRDVAVDQKDQGGVPPLVVPNVLKNWYPIAPQAVWGDVTVLTPWDVYMTCGDVDILRTQYESMRTWIDDAIRRGPDGLWEQDYWQLGDWLDPKAPPDDPGDARTNATMVADAYLVHVTYKMAEISKLIENHIDSQRYQAQAQLLKEAFLYKYLAPSGLLVSDTQTALALAIVFGIYDNKTQLETAADRLVHHVRSQKFRVTTGFAGTPVILHALTLVNCEQVAYRMLQEKNCPSWLYPVTMGATTMWERWDSMLPDSTLNTGEMTSFNHYALGSVGDWLHSVVGGIRPREAGWKSFHVAPRPGGTLRNARVAFESPYGRIECAWSLKPMDGDNSFQMSVSVPPNTQAWVVLPDSPRNGSGGQTVVESGFYSFSCTLPSKPWPLTPIKTFLYPTDDGSVA